MNNNCLTFACRFIAIEEVKLKVSQGENCTHYLKNSKTVSQLTLKDSQLDLVESTTLTVLLIAKTELYQI